MLLAPYFRLLRFGLKKLSEASNHARRIAHGN